LVHKGRIDKNHEERRLLQMLSRLALVGTDVSEESIAFIIRVTRLGEL
jgi:hypothetical protein